MNKENKSNDKLKQATHFILLYICIGFIAPIILKYAVFENTAYSLLSNDGWASFLGSYIGGVLGGLGTLFAMYMTIKQTLDIQAEDKKDSDKRLEQANYVRQREYARDKSDREIERENEKREREKERHEDNEKREREIRKQFAEEIAELVGRYITDISKYYYASIRAERLDDELKNAYTNLKNKQDELREARDELEKITGNMVSHHLTEPEYSSGNLPFMQTRKDNLTAECLELEHKYDQKKREVEENSKNGNRIVANEALFIIKTKLSDIEEGAELIEQLDKIQSSSAIIYCDASSTESGSSEKGLDADTKELIKRFSVFRDKYVSGVSLSKEGV